MNRLRRKFIPVALILALATIPATQTACGSSDLSKLHDTLLKTAKTLEAAIDTNGNLYASGLYGPVGSLEAIAKRQASAKVITDAAKGLQVALNLAKGLTKETFESGKLAVLQALSQAAASLTTTGNQTLDLVLQAAATLINQAVVLVQVFNSGIVPDIQRATPRIERHINAFGRIGGTTV